MAIDEKIVLTGSLPWDTSIAIDIDDRGNASMIVRSGSNESHIRIGGRESIEAVRDMLDRSVPKAKIDRYQRAEIAIRDGKTAPPPITGKGSARAPWTPPLTVIDGDSGKTPIP